MYRDRKGIYHKKPDSIIPKKRESAYGIYIKGSKILLVKPSWVNIWELPGGGRDIGENLFSTLKREFLEETGFEIIDFEKNPIKIINSKFYADDLDEYFDSQLSFFRIKRIDENKKLTDNEIVDLQYIPICELNKKNMNDIHLEILDLIKKWMK